QTPYHHMLADKGTMSVSGASVGSTMGGAPSRTSTRVPFCQREYCSTSWSCDCQSVRKINRGDQTAKDFCGSESLGSTRSKRTDAANHDNKLYDASPPNLRMKRPS